MYQAGSLRYTVRLRPWFWTRVAQANTQEYNRHAAEFMISLAVIMYLRWLATLPCEGFESAAFLRLSQRS